MLFNSYEFLFLFLPFTAAGFFVVSRLSNTAGAAWLGMASLVFYAWWDLPNVAILVASIIFNFLVGSRLARHYGDWPIRRIHLLLGLGVAGDLALLAYFKYLGFLVESFATITGVRADFAAVALPIGISFFTFTQIAFLVDAARGQAKEYSFVHYTLFVSFFPHLVAGPILHHREMMPQFAKAATYRPRLASLAVGAGIFVLGLAKKVLLADNIAPVADSVFLHAATTQLTIAEAWVGSLAYTLQIYFDFSGYSDMAIGLARMIGIRMPLNFNSPYKATSIIEFWRRWHMTLSRFLRDYLYIPLGGNRSGSVRRYVNLMVTMLLGGLWHGAGWAFVFWGALHGAYLVVNHFWRRMNVTLPVWPSAALTFLAVNVAWVFFRAEDMDTAVSILRSMSGLNGLDLPPRFAAGLDGVPLLRFTGLFHNQVVDPLPAMAWVAALLLVSWLAPNSQQIFGRYCLAPSGEAAAWSRWRVRPGLVTGVVAGIVLAVCLTVLHGPSPYLYFQF